MTGVQTCALPIFNQKAKILISPATLKRIFGKVKISADYTPQESTVKALQIYSGYDPNIPLTPKRKQWFIYTAPLITAVVFLLFWIFSPTENYEKLQASKLELVKIEGKGPASAYFTYSVPKSKDSIFLDFGDGSDWLHIKGANKTASHFYGYPGYFSAEIRTGRFQLAGPVKVFVPTTGWKALAHYFNEDLIERYFPVPFNVNTSNGIFHATRKNLASLGIDSTEIVVVRLDNYQNTGKNGDSFTLKSSFKNSSFWPAIRCFSVYYTIHGTDGLIQVKFVGIGCSNYSEYVIGEKSAYGGSKDLSCFTVDLHQWSDIEIRNNNKNVTVSIADSVVFDEAYTQSIGEILGTTIKFHGSGSVDYIYLNDAHDKLIYKEDFGNQVMETEDRS